MGYPGQLMVALPLISALAHGYRPAGGADEIVDAIEYE